MKVQNICIKHEFTKGFSIEGIENPFLIYRISHRIPDLVPRMSLICPKNINILQRKKGKNVIIYKK